MASCSICPVQFVLQLFNGILNCFLICLYLFTVVFFRKVTDDNRTTTHDGHNGAAKDLPWGKSLRLVRVQGP